MKIINQELKLEKANTQTRKIDNTSNNFVTKDKM